MVVAFTRLSWWLWGGKEHDRFPLNTSSDMGISMREVDSLRFPSVRGTRIQSSSRRLKRKWQSREERRIDREYDIVLVPSDGGCLSGSESDDSDWSIGWMEPHAPGFHCDDEEANFAVLVPCYGRGHAEIVDNSKNQLLGAILAGNLANSYSADGENFMEEWLSALQQDALKH